MCIMCDLPQKTAIKIAKNFRVEIIGNKIHNKGCALRISCEFSEGIKLMLALAEYSQSVTL